jgi:hypothetical protein
MSNKTGRNEFCPCGSHKKFKKCCLIQEVAGSSHKIILRTATKNMIGLKVADVSEVAVQTKMY